MMCPKAKKIALSIMKDANTPFWDKAEAEAYLRNEAIRPVVWKAGKPIFWRVELSDSYVLTDEPAEVFDEWLREMLA